MSHIHSFSQLPTSSQPKSPQPQPSFLFPNLSSNSALERLFPKHKLLSFSTLILVSNVLIFLVTWFMMKLGKKEQICILLKFGGMYTPVVQHQAEVWRVFTAAFLHAGWQHIIMNMLSLSLFIWLIEHHLGPTRFIISYILMCITGNLLSGVAYKWNNSLSVGASGAVFGIFALILAYYLQNYHKLGPNRNLVIGIFAGIVLLQFLAGFQSEQQQNFANNDKEQSSDDGSNKIDVLAHLGGFIAGTALGILFYQKIDDTIWARRKIKILVGMLFCIIICVLCTLIFTIDVEDGKHLINYCANK